MKKHILYGLAFIALLGFNACNNEEIETLGDPSSIEKGKITFALNNRASKVTTYGEVIETDAEKETGQLGIYYFDEYGDFIELFSEANENLDHEDNIYTLNVGDNSGVGKFMIVDVPDTEELPTVANASELQTKQITYSGKINAPFYWAHLGSNQSPIITVNDVSNPGEAKSVNLIRRAVRVDLCNFADDSAMGPEDVALRSVLINRQNTNFSLAFGESNPNYDILSYTIEKASLANQDDIPNGGTFYLLPTTLGESKTTISLNVKTIAGYTTAELNIDNDVILETNKRYIISASYEPTENKVSLNLSYADWNDGGSIGINVEPVIVEEQNAAGFGPDGLLTVAGATYDPISKTITYSSLSEPTTFSIPANGNEIVSKIKLKNSNWEETSYSTDVEDLGRVVVTLSAQDHEIHNFSLTVDHVTYEFVAVRNPLEYPTAEIYDASNYWAMYIGHYNGDGTSVQSGATYENKDWTWENINHVQTDRWFIPRTPSTINVDATKSAIAPDYFYGYLGIWDYDNLWIPWYNGNILLAFNTNTGRSQDFSNGFVAPIILIYDAVVQ
jgi:hypothetical protein